MPTTNKILRTFASLGNQPSERLTVCTGLYTRAVLDFATAEFRSQGLDLVEADGEMSVAITTQCENPRAVIGSFLNRLVALSVTRQ